LGGGGPLFSETQLYGYFFFGLWGGGAGGGPDIFSPPTKLVGNPHAPPLVLLGVAQTKTKKQKNKKRGVGAGLSVVTKTRVRKTF